MTTTEANRIAAWCDDQFMRMWARERDGVDGDAYEIDEDDEQESCDCHACGMCYHNINETRNHPCM